MTITARPVPEDAAARLRGAGVSPVLARLLAARGVADPAELSQELARLLSPDLLAGAHRAADLLDGAIRRGEKLCVIADYDCDGATACAVAVRGLRMMGAKIDYLVPNRFEHGYGLTPPIVELALAHPRLGRPDWLITVDNGIASVEGIEAARAAGLRTIVTDHHLPGPELPAADAIVNPNQPGCGFPSKALAGVGVMFYVLLAARAAIRSHSPDSPAASAPLQTLLDLVALGTVADLVRLDANNRLLVAAGLRRIRAGRACEGIRALLRAAGRDESRATASDLGFAVGPRINAAGRLADISLGIACLLEDDPAQAQALAAQLDAINRERRDIEQTMREQALDSIGEPPPGRRTIVVHREGWHEGVVGLVASRVKEAHHRPAVAFAPSAADPALLRGSGRSIPGVHLRDALDLVAKREPGVLLRFGGHAMAAGMTLFARELERFSAAFEAAVAELADPSCFVAELRTDGPLAPSEIGLELVGLLESQVWGQGFPEPLFADRFSVLRQSVVGGRHLKLELAARGSRFSGIAFGRTEPLPDEAMLAYRLSRNEYRGIASVQLIVEAAEPAPGYNVGFD